MPIAAETVAELVRSRIGVTAHTDHPHPFDVSELPAWRVEYEIEPVAAATLDGAVFEHRLEIHARGYVRAASSADAALNVIASAALDAIFAAPVPYGLEPGGEIERRLEGEGEAATAVVDIPLRAHFFTSSADPNTILS
jgi:hypothetical protein